MSDRIVVVGSINADLNVHVVRHPKPGETLLGSGGNITAGGKGANQAVAAALQGVQVAFIGAVGNDTYVEPALEYLKSSGVDLSAVATTQETTGLAVITIAADGENNIVVVPGANALVTAEMVASHGSLLADAGIVLLQGEIPADGFKEAVHQTTGRVVVNLAPVIEVDREALLELIRSSPMNMRPVLFWSSWGQPFIPRNLMSWPRLSWMQDSTPWCSPWEGLVRWWRWDPP